MIYGYDEKLVESAVGYEMMQENSSITGMPVLGEFKKEGKELIFNMEIMINGEIIKFPVENCDVDIEILNSERCSKYLIDDKRADSYMVIFGIGDNEEEAEENLWSQLVSFYLKENKITSKKKVEKLIERFAVGARLML